MATTLPGIQVQPAQFPKDAQLIQAIAQVAWRDTFEPLMGKDFVDHELEREYSPEALIQQHEAGHAFFILFDPSGQGVGYASVEVLSQQQRLKLHKLYLLPQLKGKGYGRYMLETIEAFARSHHLNHIELLVYRKNPSVGFYQALGFAIIQELDTPVGPDFWRYDYVMVKPLTR